MLSNTLFLCLVATIISARMRLTLAESPPSKGESCNLNINVGKSSEPEPPSLRNPGAPGKKGPVGPIGPKGQKGTKGEVGLDAEGEKLKANVMRMLGASSCAELETIHGVNTTGYYLMKPPTSDSTVYVYCNFEEHANVADCKTLIKQYRVQRQGYYKVRKTPGANPVFLRCLDVYTCHQLQERDGVGKSGFYTLGSGDQTYEVYCNLQKNQAITEVWHDSMSEVLMPNIEAAGGYSRIPQYSITYGNIMKIIDNSEGCKQFIKNRCKGTDSGARWWISREGVRMNYWGGATSHRNHYCACGETGTCFKTNLKCNCAGNDNNRVVVDEGYLTDKTKLPVREMRFGDMGADVETGWHTLGKLECYPKDVYTCHQLRERDGVEKSGFYALGHVDQTYEVYCNFQNTQAITEVWHDSMGEVLMPHIEPPGGYSRVPKYSITHANIMKIINNSGGCKQFIKHRCRGAKSSYRWWISRDGLKMNYWGGATSHRDHYCACGETGTCISKTHKCNCASNDNSLVTADEGYLTDKTKLPVREMRFGDMSNPPETGWHTLGKLECFAEA